MVVADHTARQRGHQGFSDLADVRRLLDQIDIDPLVEVLTGPFRVGRPVLPREPILRAYLASYALGIPNTSALVRRLHNDPALRSVCGFVDYLPDLSTFSRVFQSLAEQYVELVEQCCAQITGQLAQLLPDFGKEVAVDSTTVAAYANPLRGKDPDASWTKKHSAQAESGKAWVFGYKAHVIADANHELPISMIVTTASRNDSPMFKPLLEKAESEHDWFAVSNSVVIADRGYDSKRNNEYVHGKGGAPVIHKRRFRHERQHGAIYTTDGVPICLGQLPMDFIRTDPQTGQHLYRCPAIGCDRKNQNLPYTTCDDESLEDPEQDIRLFGGKIRRASWNWTRKYSKRVSVERLFSRWKYPGRLERHCYLKLTKIHAIALFVADGGIVGPSTGEEIMIDEDKVVGKLMKDYQNNRRFIACLRKTLQDIGTDFTELGQALISRPADVQVSDEAIVTGRFANPRANRTVKRSTLDADLIAEHLNELQQALV